MSRPTKSSDEIQPYARIQDAEWAGIFSHVARQGSLAAGIRSTIGERRAPAVYAALRRDLDLKARLASAEQEFRDGLLAELVRRGRDGVDKPLTYKGDVVGYVKEYSDNALLAACRHYLDSWVDKRSTSDVSHHVTMESPGALWMIGEDDLSHLDDTDKRQLAAIIKKVQAGRNAAIAAEREFQALEHHPDAVDVQFEEAASGDPFDLAEVAKLA